MSKLCKDARGCTPNTTYSERPCMLVTSRSWPAVTSQWFAAGLYSSSVRPSTYPPLCVNVFKLRIFLVCIPTNCVSPWYNRRGWLGVKNQLSIYLSTRQSICHTLSLSLSLFEVLLSSFHLLLQQSSALCKGMWNINFPLLTKMHSSCDVPNKLELQITCKTNKNIKNQQQKSSNHPSWAVVHNKVEWKPLLSSCNFTGKFSFNLI